jgi:hypothetical protein
VLVWGILTMYCMMAIRVGGTEAGILDVCM